jgi:hypothetical protein
VGVRRGEGGGSTFTTNYCSTSSICSQHAWARKKCAATAVPHSTTPPTPSMELLSPTHCRLCSRQMADSSVPSPSILSLNINKYIPSYRRNVNFLEEFNVQFK